MSTWIHCLWGPFMQIFKRCVRWPGCDHDIKKPSYKSYRHTHLRAPERCTPPVPLYRSTHFPHCYKDILLKSTTIHVVKYDVFLDILLRGSIYVIKCRFPREKPKTLKIWQIGCKVARPWPRHQQQEQNQKRKSIYKHNHVIISKE